MLIILYNTQVLLTQKNHVLWEAINMSEVLAPKTCSIERLVTVENDVKLVLSGVKQVTRRNGRYADPGEIMELRGQSFEVYKVYQQAIGEMTDADAKAEGYTDIETYKQYILSMHKGMPWIPHAKVWVHEFRPVNL
jgi:N4-acetylcytidine amidohydrolase